MLRPERDEFKKVLDFYMKEKHFGGYTIQQVVEEINSEYLRLLSEKPEYKEGMYDGMPTGVNDVFGIMIHEGDDVKVGGHKGFEKVVFSKGMFMVDGYDGPSLQWFVDERNLIVIEPKE